ncbi:MAG TPA: PP2C family protein-serine/threonine phosphatase [Candidatus Dormibacteraeota bacterium]|nr:PP2C family protein-serine/threonine phosphatase [Candidatus Dormibacteraeota bacterium]
MGVKRPIFPEQPLFVSVRTARRKVSGHVRDFWGRLSEDSQIDDLWAQFAADTRASYGFYGRDVDWAKINQLPGWRKPLHIANQFFWALMLKLTPARRVMVLLALIMLVLSGIKFHFGENINFSFNFEFAAAALLLLLLFLELSDKVIMKRDLEIAREIQTWLVPAYPPEVTNADIAFATRPQNSVAGDYYDAFFPLNDGARGGKLLVVIADVAGKSVPAALLMATFQASLRTIAGGGVTLHELVHRLNQYASAHSLDGRRFTTAVVAEYEPATRRFTYVNAGHNHPVLRRANGEMQRLDKGGLPLGILAEATYEVASLEMHPGDLLVFYTDGVVEAFNESGEQFSEAQWAEVVQSLPALSAAESLRFLMQRVDGFVGMTRQSDDITCLVFRVE